LTRHGARGEGDGLVGVGGTRYTRMDWGLSCCVAGEGLIKNSVGMAPRWTVRFLLRKREKSTSCEGRGWG